MASSRTAWGIDVGNRALKAVKVVREGDGFRIDDFDLIEHETPLDQSGDNRESLVAKSLAAFVGRHKLGKTPVGVAVSGNQAFAKFIKLPPVEEKNIPNIVRFEAIQQIPFPIDDVEWQFQLFRKTDDPEVEVGIFAMRKDLVNHYVSAYTDLKLNVQAVQMSAMAVYNALYQDGRLDQTTLVIDVGAATTDLLVADGETVWHRSIPIGGNNFTEALVRMFSGKKTFAEAEEMKREASTHKYARQIFQAMRPVFGDLVAEVQRSIGFYSSTHPNVKITKAIALGGTLKLPGLQKYLQQNLSLEVEAVKAFAAEAPADAKLAASYEENAIAAVTAYGLAMQAAGEAKIGTSLLPTHIRNTMIWQEKAKWFAASAALFVVGAGVAFAGVMIPAAQLDSEEAKADRSKVDSVITEAKGLDSGWSAVQSDGDTDRQTIKNARGLLADRSVWPEIVGAIHDSVPLGPPDPKALAAIPREQRETLKIDQWSSFYVSAIGPLLGDARRAKYWGQVPVSVSPDGAPVGAAPDQGGGGRFGFGGGNSPGMTFGGGAGQASTDDIEIPDVPKEIVTAAATTPGFVLRVTGVTPNKNVVGLLTKTMFAKLIATRVGSANATRDFYVADVFLVRQGKVSANSVRMADMLRSYIEVSKLRGTAGTPGAAPVPAPQQPGRPPGFPGGGEFLPPGGPPGGPQGGPVGGAANPSEDPTPYLDPLTKEDMRKDNEFAALVFIVLGSPPPPAPPATPAP
jgi:type IV pilus assembly protein PilM